MMESFNKDVKYVNCVFLPKYLSVMDKSFFSRDILSSRGLSWLPGSHLNSHSSSAKQQLVMEKIFDGVSKQILRSAKKKNLGLTSKNFPIHRKLVNLYKTDFEFCGYHESLHQLQSLL